MKKKILPFLLMIAFMLSAAANAYAEDKDYSREINILKALDIIRAYSDDGYNAELELTRGEAAFMAANMMNFPLDSSKYTNSDGTVNWSECAADYMIDSGIFSVKNTEQPIKGTDFAKILVSLLGYDIYAEGNGGYPNGYIKTAGNIGLLDGGISINGEPVTKGKAAAIMFNALSVNVAEDKSLSDKTVKITDENILERKHNIYHAYGRVTRTSKSGLDSAEGLKDGMLEVDGILYETDNSAYDGLLGLETELYYHESNDGSRTILYIEQRRGYNETIRIDAADIIEYKNFTYRFYRNEKIVSKTILPSADVIYNDVFSGELSGTDYVPSDGYAELTDTDRDGKYDFVRITSYTTVVTGYYDSEENILYDKLSSAKTDLGGNVKIFDGEKEISAQRLSENDVLLLKISRDGESVEGHLSRNSVSGKITSLSQDGDDTKAVIDGEEYIINKAFSKSTAYRLKTGTEAVYYLDFNGKITWCTDIKTAEGIGYIIKVSKADGDEEAAYVRLLTSDGKISLAKTAPRVKIDGIICKKAEDAVSYFNGVSCAAAYTTNGEGLITVIDTPAYNDKKEDKNSLTNILGACKTLRYKRSSKIFGERMAIDDSTVIFLVPSSYSSNTSLYRTEKNTFFINDKNYPVEGYRQKQGHGAADILVVYDNSDWNKMTQNSYIARIESVGQRFDTNEDKTVYYADVKGTKSGSLSADDDIDLSSYSSGDIIFFNLSNEGKIKAVKRIYSEKSGQYDKNALPEGYSVGIGYVYYKDYPYLTVAEYLPETGMFDEEKLKLYKGDACGVFLEIASRKDKQFKSGSVNEMCDYETAGEDCTKVFTVTLNNDVRIIFELK